MISQKDYDNLKKELSDAKAEALMWKREYDKMLEVVSICDQMLTEIRKQTKVPSKFVTFQRFEKDTQRVQNRGDEKDGAPRDPKLDQ